MELDLLGLGLPPATPAGAPVGSVAPWPCDKTALDEPLRPDAAAAETPSLPVRARVCPRPVDMDDDVPAPPAHTLKPTPPTAASWPARPSSPKLGSFLSGIFQVAPTMASDLAAGGQQGHVAMRSSPLQTAGCPAANALVGTRPPVAAGPTFEAAARSARDDSTAPMTIIYDGSVRAFYRVPMEQAEKILSMVAEHAQAAETLPVQRPADQAQSQSAAAATPSSATQMMIMLWRLAQLEDSLVPKRTASLARFLNKRKQRVEGAAATPYRRGEDFPAQMNVFTTVSARNTAQFAGVERPLSASEDRPKSMEENHGEEANTELKI